jgi:Reverse transcriptase (RNA-dependent DNA polymerase)
MIQTRLKHLHSHFAIKELDHLTYFLGIEVKPTSTGFHLSQSKYIKDLLIKSNMINSKTYTTPIATSHALSLHDNPPFDNFTLYRNIARALQYAK